MIPSWLLEGRMLSAFSRVIVALAVVSGLSVLGFLGRLYWAGEKLKSLQSSTLNAEQELKTIEQEIAKAPLLRKANSPNKEQALAQFQSDTYASSSKNGVMLRDITATPELQAYLSKYSNDEPPAGWQQAPVKLTLDGRIQDILASMEQLRKSQIPFEIDQVDVNRAAIDQKTGATVVSAQLQLRVLVRG